MNLKDKPKEISYTNKVIMIGFGSIGQGIIPLLFKHLNIQSDQIIIITADPISQNPIAQKIINQFNLKILINPLTQENYLQILEPLLNQNDFLLNLSVEVSSVALIRLAHDKNALYLDTCIEPWAGGYTATINNKTLYDCTNYAMREQAIDLKQDLKQNLKQKNNPTAILCQGANPGLISQFVKQALLNIAKDNNINVQPKAQTDWALLAQKLNIKAIHVAEHDTQITNIKTQNYNNFNFYNNEFYNTWSVDGFLSEGLQPAELSFGTHEKQLPIDGNKCKYDQNIVYLNQPGLNTKVRTWTPIAGAFHGYLITHNEAITLSEFLRVTDNNNKTVYCPTIHYSYKPCDDTILSIQQLKHNEYIKPEKTIVLQSEIIDGYDELGVLLMGNQKGAYWYGSRLSITEARKLCEFNSATSLQVVAGVISGMMWAVEHPNMGIIEPEQLDLTEIMAIASPYLGKLFGEYTTWTPLLNRDVMFPESLDWDDPWQFSNIRV